METSPTPDIRALEERLEVLEAERQILRTMYRYMHSMDYGHADEWVDCFTPDGTLHVHGRAGGTRRAEGRTALAEFMTGHIRAAGQYNKHLLFDPILTVQGSEATAMSYIATLVEHDGKPAVGVFGRYLDRFVQCPDGVWRLKERRIEQEAGTPIRRIE